MEFIGVQWRPQWSPNFLWRWGQICVPHTPNIIILPYVVIYSQAISAEPEVIPAQSSAEDAGDETEVKVAQAKGKKRGKSKPSPTLNTTSPALSIPTPKSNTRSTRLTSFDDTVRGIAEGSEGVYEYEGRKPLNTNEWCDLWEPCYIELTTNPESTLMFDEADAIDSAPKAYTVTQPVSFSHVCKHHGIPFEFHDSYHLWLTLHTDIDVDDMPRGRSKVAVGTVFPRPTGSSWRDVIAQRMNNMDEHERARSEKDLTEAALQATLNQIRMEACLGNKNLPSYKRMNKAREKAKAVREKAVAQGQMPPPKNTLEAWTHPTMGHDWVDASYDEWEGLTKLGVIKHGYTMDELRNADIPPPINLSVGFVIKTKNNIFERCKVRCCLAGHSGNVKQGVHYDKTFAASPNQHSMRLMQALLVKHKWKRRSFDITQAYLHADLDKDRYISVKYPPGFEQYKTDKEGNHIVDSHGRLIPLYCVIAKNIYGLPSGSRNWNKHRDEFILDTYNKDVTINTDTTSITYRWSCHRCLMDPCLFRFKRSIVTRDGSLSSTVTSIALIYTDDVDMIGDDDDMMKYVRDTMDEKWGVRDVSSDNVLGVQRTLNDDGDEVTLTMSHYVDTIVALFEDHLPSKVKETPFPDTVFLSKDDKSVTDEEAKRVLARGYQKAMGCLLWAARNVFCCCMVGVSMLCRVMSRPSELAWSSAMHMVAWLRDHKSLGLRFSHKGNASPIAFVDASNKPDPSDGKAQYGYNITYHGGPIIFLSKKLNHVGLNAFHNEYMAMCECAKAIVWLRQLLAELGEHESIEHPTLCYGDNNAALSLTVEDFVSTGNQYVYLPYHFNKEVSKLGYVVFAPKKSEFNLADVFTKPVTRGVLTKLLDYLCGYKLITTDVVREGL